ncbi:MAG: ZIP family metal transporter, partial [Candidatus Micrarchaeota archaeon]|nr:ZIP family metal transporter [Candidatus Micrarchaeota archaeon]
MCIRDRYMIAFAVGGMLGGAMFHLLPEAVEDSDEPMLVFALALAGFIAFFIIEKFLHWRHCHDEECDVHGHEQNKAAIKPVAYLNLIGDMIHNFVDGAIIAASFMAGAPLGIATTIAIALHEIPQELGDFAVLLHSGLSPRKAVAYNFLSALGAVLGALLTYYALASTEGLASILLPVAAGGFVYIAAVDLVPELHKERKPLVSALQLGMIVFGLALMYYLKAAFGG